MMMKFRALARPLNLEKSEGVGAPGPVQCVGTHITSPMHVYRNHFLTKSKNF
jgi:hypothetical protein